jgi:transposase
MIDIGQSGAEAVRKCKYQIRYVATNVMGVSGRAMLAALMEGNASPEEMAELSRGRLREKRAALEQALTGRFHALHRFVLTEF